MGEFVDLKVKCLLELNKSQDLISSWTEFDVFKKLSSQSIQMPLHSACSELLASIYRGAAIKLDDHSVESLELLVRSYDLWKMIWYSNQALVLTDAVKQLFHLVCTGILIDSFAEVRMILLEVNFEKKYDDLANEHWPIYLEHSIYLILLVLIRKGNGWDDIKFVERIIKEIQARQEKEEESYFSKLEESGADLNLAICWIAALLNVLEGLEVYKNYMLKGKPENVEKVIIRFLRDAAELLNNSYREVFFVDLIEKVLIKLVSVSIWSSVQGISGRIDTYLEMLTLETNLKPIFELWPSQQRAISQNLFDNSKTAIVVQMPTSAGKTLLAKFYILQTLNLFDDSKIAYIVPTRALVNQVRNDLRRDFSCLGNIKVDIAIPYSEVDEIEDTLLLQNADIIVTTPEKLDILLRTNHPIVSKLRLVVVDEAHNLQAQSRGSRLELLLTMLRKQNRNLRILLLSPFMSNASKIANWLGGNRGVNIHVDWKPAQQFSGMHRIKTIGRGKHEGIVEYIPSSLNSVYNRSFTVPIYTSTRKDISKIKQAFELAKIYRKTGGVLVLCSQRRYAENLARLFLIVEDLGAESLEKLKYLLSLIKAEMGEDCLLYSCVKKGAAYHHSSLPLIIREEIEDAIADRLIDVVAATTTLAQGMNFPISTVIFQGMGMSDNGFTRPMEPSEFWNIAGRAGRALTDKEGHIIAITHDENQVQQFKRYLTNKNQEVLSSLFELIASVPEDQFNSYWLERSKQLSSLLQYIYHIVMLDEDIEIEDILRGTLIYNQLEEAGKKVLAEKLVRLTKNYVNHINPDKKRKKLMETIDKSGLSSISMHKLISIVRHNSDISISVDALFGKDSTNLQRVIEIINEIPELKLGIFNTNGKLNAKLIAEITRDWVDGLTIREIALRNIPDTQETITIDEKINHCGKYIYGTLINNIPWGVSALMRVKGIISEEKLTEDTSIPSYIYFGAKTKEAVAFSMLGAPRFASEALAELWRKEKGEIDLKNLHQLEKWVNDFTKERWNRLFKENGEERGNMAYRAWRKQNGS